MIYKLYYIFFTRSQHNYTNIQVETDTADGNITNKNMYTHTPHTIYTCQSHYYLGILNLNLQLKTACWMGIALSLMWSFNLYYDTNQSVSGVLYENFDNSCGTPAIIGPYVLKFS